MGECESLPLSLFIGIHDDHRNPMIRLADHPTCQTWNAIRQLQGHDLDAPPLQTLGK